jgi:hypothetical protein
MPSCVRACKTEVDERQVSVWVWVWVSMKGHIHSLAPDDLGAYAFNINRALLRPYWVHCAWCPG